MMLRLVQQGCHDEVLTLVHERCVVVAAVIGGWVETLWK